MKIPTFVPDKDRQLSMCASYKNMKKKYIKPEMQDVMLAELDFICHTGISSSGTAQGGIDVLGKKRGVIDRTDDVSFGYSTLWGDQQDVTEE